ncbi:MAG TPA: YbhB/YbcL family Raf kinase inhibitor-like protein [Solimonas sp.]|nr:YbhB/YbcL family Raf kinase inhibitor-like protein [Solimonas sp.]
MKLASRSFADNGLIPGRCAFCVRAPRGHVRLSANLSPQLSWSGAPAGTRSFVLLCTDSDVPTKPDDVNREGREVPPDLKRGEFAHWAMVDIPPQVTRLAEGACSHTVTAKGKRKPSGPEGARQGANDYTGWFAGDPAMAGTYLGYDGPCPPWNDSLVHHYRFEVLATDLERCPVKGAFTVAEVRKAIEGHVLARASRIGRYSLNPRLRVK